MAILTPMDEIFQLQAEVLKALSSPRRLEIIHHLAGGPVEVSRLAEWMGISQPNVSQHLALMRAAGVVDFEREGREVRYRLVDPEIITACDLMRGVLKRRLARMAGLSVLAGERPASSAHAAPAASRDPAASPTEEPSGRTAIEPQSALNAVPIEVATNG